MQPQYAECAYDVVNTVCKENRSDNCVHFQFFLFCFVCCCGGGGDTGTPS